MNEFLLLLALLGEAKPHRPAVVPAAAAEKVVPVVHYEVSPIDRQLVREYVARVARCGTGEVTKHESGFYVPVLRGNCK